MIWSNILCTAALANKHPKPKYNEEQWKKLHEYWAHPLFMRVRPCGYVIAILAMLCIIAPVFSTNWVRYDVFKETNFTYSK